MENLLESSSEVESSITPHSVLSAVDLNALATEVVNDAIALSEKADRILAEWQQRYNPTEPVLANLEDCVELFRQGQQIRFPDDLFEQPHERYYPEHRKSATRGSIVAEIDQQQLADAVAELLEAQALEQAIELAHSEDIDAWIEIVRLVLTQPMGLSELVEKLDLSVVQVWIALMFGGFPLERSGDFYEGSIVIFPTKNPPQALGRID